MIPLSDPESPRHSTPYVNIGLIVINVLVFLYTLVLSGLDQNVFFFQFGVVPLEFTGSEELTTVRFGDTPVDVTSPIPLWATLLTSMFIHGGIMHVLSNMVFLWVFGDNVEDRMGHVGYLAFYLVAGMAASGAHILFNWESFIPTVGASGAIAGVLGAYLLFFPYHRVRTLIMFYFIMVKEIPAVWVLGFWAFTQLFSGVGAIGVSTQSGGVAYWAHIGGFAVGLAVVAAGRILRGQPVWQPHGARRSFRF